jgi:hypothetical protein
VVVPLIVVGLIGALMAWILERVRRARFAVQGTDGKDAVTAAHYVSTFNSTLRTLGATRTSRRQHVAELKANLADAVAHHGLGAALDGLGPAGALATNYADYTPRPRWLAGIAWASFTWVMLAVVNAQLASAYEVGARNALGLGAPLTEAQFETRTPLLLTYLSDFTASGEVTATVTSPWLMVVTITVLVAASRTWRLIPMREKVNSPS